MDNAGNCAVAAGALYMVPYFGPVIVAICNGVADFLRFGSWSPALLTAAASLAVATVIGTLVTTLMTGLIARMNDLFLCCCLPGADACGERCCRF